MPIGVPKVPYRLPGEKHPQWVDIYNCLSRERILFLTQDLTDEITNQLIGLILYLNSEDKKTRYFSICKLARRIGDLWVVSS